MTFSIGDRIYYIPRGQNHTGTVINLTDGYLEISWDNNDRDYKYYSPVDMAISNTVRAVLNPLEFSIIERLRNSSYRIVIKPGTIFNTALENTCIAVTEPDKDGSFLGINPEGHDYNYNINMVTKVIDTDTIT